MNLDSLQNQINEFVLDFLSKKKIRTKEAWKSDDIQKKLNSILKNSLEKKRTPFMNFYREFKEKLSAEYPDLPGIEIKKKICHLWKTEYADRKGEWDIAGKDTGKEKRNSKSPSLSKVLREFDSQTQVRLVDFVFKVKPILVKENPDLPFSEIVKMIDSEWREFKGN